MKTALINKVKRVISKFSKIHEAFSICHISLLVLDILSKSDTEIVGLQMIERSNGKLPRGTIYVTLMRLEEQGLISSHGEARSDPQIELNRRVYKISELGRLYLLTQNSLVNNSYEFKELKILEILSKSPIEMIGSETIEKTIKKSRGLPGLGSIYECLRQLMTKGLVVSYVDSCVDFYIENSSVPIFTIEKRIYTITNAGREYLAHLLNSQTTHF